MFNGIKSMFHPKYPKKYLGDITKIFSRSNLEKKFMQYFDNNENIISWASEEFCVEYISPLDNKQHRYFPDFFIKVRDKAGNEKKYIIEIKPDIQTRPPKKRGAKKETQYLCEMLEYAKNQAKWDACKAFCERRGIEFKVLTEKSIPG